MTSQRIAIRVVVLCLFATASLRAQSGSASAANSGTSVSVVPRLIKFSGVIGPQVTQINDNETLKDLSGTPIMVAFSLYELQEGGGPLWSEAQKVQLDEQGRYTVLLGATQPEGLPLDLFTSGQALWVGVQPQLPGAGEQPRVLLVSVPYALEAGDAATLGGKPASAYLLAQPVEGLAPAVSQTAGAAGTGVKAPSPEVSTLLRPAVLTATQNYIPVMTDNSGSLGNSVMYQNGSSIGIGTLTPGAQLDLLSSGESVNFGPGTIGFPSPAAVPNGGSLTGRGTTSNYRFAIQDGTGRVNQYWNAYANTSGTTHSYYVTGEPAVRMNWGGTGQGTIRFQVAPAGTAGQPINWTEALFVDNTGRMGIANVTPAAQLDVRGSAESLYFGAGSIGFSTPASVPTGGSLVGRGSTSNYRFAIQDGTGRVNQYWNAYANPSGTHTYYVTGEPAVRMNWGGTGQGTIRFQVAPAGTAGQAIPWTEGLFMDNSGNVGLGTITPAAKLDVAGNINSSGTVSAASFSGSGAGLTGVGTVTSVGSGAGLTGGPITTTGTLSIASGGVSDAMLANPYSGVGTCAAGKVVTGLGRNAAPSCITAGTVTSVGTGLGLTGGPITSSGTLSIDTSVVPQLGAATNTFSGSIVASSFSGNGSGLTNVNALNANELGGLTPDSYVKHGSPNAFSAIQTLAPTGTATSGVPYSSYALNHQASSWDGSQAVTQNLVWEAEGSGSSNTGTLNLLYATGPNPTTFAETGLSIGAAGDLSTVDSAVGNSNFIPVAISAVASDVSSANTGISGAANGPSGTGVVGDAENGGAAIGVWGMSSSGYAGEFTGNLDVTGTLTAATKNFKIDDPSDPANKYMYHASVESSEMVNIYSGNVTLDDSGEATVQVPAWLETLNGDFRYQLTCIGGYAPVYIAEEIAHGQFRVAGGKPGMKVSWQVTGVRQDAFARAHPLQVEVDKPEKEKGFYIHPELYGAGKDKSIQWANHPEQMKRMAARQAKAAESKRQ
jgi:hypothetical protein